MFRLSLILFICCFGQTINSEQWLRLELVSRVSDFSSKLNEALPVFSNINIPVPSLKQCKELVFISKKGEAEIDPV